LVDHYPSPETHFGSEQPHTLDDIKARREQRRLLEEQNEKRKEHENRMVANGEPRQPEGLEAGAEQLEVEAGQQGAFNEETGEINWDCPCLGGMADGPCGENFKEAFSCFVFSKEEPKGVDCIEKFK
jgi:intermembrane space import and assembly protein 40